MLTKIAAISFVFALAGCASATKFQKTDAGPGYSVKELDAKDHLEVSVRLGDGAAAERVRDYGWRAVGEECHSRGFGYFSAVDVTPSTFEGFCYTSSTVKSMAITFQSAGLEAEPKKFVVEGLNGKTGTKLMVGDELLKMNGQKLTSMAQIKSLVFVSSKTKNSLPVEVVRGGKTMKLEEPLAQTANGAFGQDMLDRLRSKVQ